MPPQVQASTRPQQHNASTTFRTEQNAVGPGLPHHSVAVQSGVLTDEQKSAKAQQSVGAQHAEVGYYHKKIVQSYFSQFRANPIDTPEQSKVP